METLKDFFEKYKIDQTESLDQKNFGSVYTAIDQETQKKWAVKITEVHPAFDSNLLLERYTNAQQLEHSNLLPYVEAHRFEEDGVTNIAVMPLMQMGGLDNYWDLSNEDKKLIIDQVLDGLYYLHAHQFIWQNLSAQHILLEKDFGNYVPKFINYGNTQKIPLVFFADYEYLAPEQFDDNNVINEQTDIWAYGVLLYRIWAGRLPFGEKSASLPNSKIQDRILGNWELGVMGKIPEPYQTITKKCLQKEKEARWNNCGEIIDVIKNWQSTNHSESLLEEERGDLTTTRRILRKPNKPIIWWQVVLLFVLAAILGYWIGENT